MATNNETSKNKNTANNKGKRDKHFITNLRELKLIACPLSEEQETTINVSRTDIQMTIFTSDNTMLTKLKKRAFTPTILDNNNNNNGNDNVEGGGQIRKDWKCWEGSLNREGEPTGYFFSAPKQLLSFRSEIVERELTEEQREAFRTRMEQARSKED